MKTVFISDLTARAYIDSSKRRTLTKQDVINATAKSDLFDFLIDIAPRDGIPSNINPGSKLSMVREVQAHEDDLSSMNGKRTSVAAKQEGSPDLIPDPDLEDEEEEDGEEYED